MLFHGYRSRDAVREKDRLPDQCHAEERGAAAQRQRFAHQPFRRHCVVPGRRAGLGDLKKNTPTLPCIRSGGRGGGGGGGGGRREGGPPAAAARGGGAGGAAGAGGCCSSPPSSSRGGAGGGPPGGGGAPDLPTLRSPATIMKLAREQGALYEIERLTFTKALETFDSLCRAGSVSGDAMLFVNSIASTCLTQADVDYIDSRWHELRRRMVIEITEEEEIDYEALERKRNAPGFSGMFALDDYGSGYSNENTLLQLAPRFVKVDITIIRGIDTSPDKQQILRNMVAYAHPPQHEDRCRGRGDRRRAVHGHRAGRRPFAGLFSGTPGHCAGSDRAGSSGDHPGVAAPEKRLKYMPSRALRRWEGFCNGGKKIWFRWISSPAFWAQARPPFCAAMCGIWYSRGIRCAFWKTTLAR